MIIVLFNIFSADGDYVYSYDILQSMRMFEHSKIPHCVHQLFNEQGPNVIIFLLKLQYPKSFLLS